MNGWNLNNRDCRRGRKGIVLLVTLVLLVVLSILVYTLSSRVAAQCHRDRYLIDYQAARYGCDSAAKYAMAMIEDMNTPELIDRPNEPDFSDLFILSDSEYEELLASRPAENTPAKSKSFADVNDVNYAGSGGRNTADPNNPDTAVIRGPYGPPWPLIMEPAEFKIGSVTVRIEIEDENAKYPICWGSTNEEKILHEAMAGLGTFCEWMGFNYSQARSLRLQLKEIGRIKPYRSDFRPIAAAEKTTAETRAVSGRTRRAGRGQTVAKVAVPAMVHNADLAKLLHSSLIDIEALARPTIVSESRKESAIKYIGMWASEKVNVNTAPRHVLEAAFSFGGDADKVAEEIIRRRRITPFKDIEDLRKSLFRYSGSITKCERYIMVTSDFFTIRVTAVSGVSKVTAVIAVVKNGSQVERVDVISG